MVWVCVLVADRQGSSQFWLTLWRWSGLLPLLGFWLCFGLVSFGLGCCFLGLGLAVCCGTFCCGGGLGYGVFLGLAVCCVGGYCWLVCLVGLFVVCCGRAGCYAYVCVGL